MHGSAYSATEEGRAFLQERIGLLGGWEFCFSGGFLLVGVFITLALPQGAWAGGVFGPQNFFHAAATALLGIAWWLCRATTMSIPVLRVLGAGLVILTCALFALMGAAITSEPIIGTFVALLAATHTVVFRSIVVPSTAPRTVWIAAVAFVPVVATTVFLMTFTAYQGALAVGFVVSTSTWCAVGTGVAAVASHVLFGLRRDVREARQLGQYTLEAKIGEGGMGTVYRASHMMLRRPTAIKLLPPEKAGEESVRRFEREVQLTALLSHPNTVSIYDYGRTPDGVFYYAMEFLDGVDLQNLVRDDGPQAPDRVIHILTQVCGALSEVNLIHRDIKPANIILTARGGEPDVVKVVDFGLVKHVDTGGEDVTVTAAQNLLIGSPLYMSPEAIRAPDEVDARSDLYAVGAVGYFLLTGETVFDGKSLVTLPAPLAPLPHSPPLPSLSHSHAQRSGVQSSFEYRGSGHWFAVHVKQQRHLSGDRDSAHGVACDT